jgi:hypothetical protein
LARNSGFLFTIAREELGPILLPLGLNPTRNARGVWAGTLNALHVQLRLQASKWNDPNPDDPNAFTVELHLASNEPLASARLFGLLSTEELEEHRKIQNQVIARMPLDETELDSLPPEWQADRLLRVAPRLAPYPPNPGPDVWFNYLDATDIHRWMQFIGRVLPGAINRLVAALPRSDPEAIQLDRIRAVEMGSPLRADDADVRAADEAMRRLPKADPPG